MQSITFISVLFTFFFALSGAKPLRVSSDAQDLSHQESLFRRSTQKTTFHHAATNSTITYVANSGVCETTPGVNQYSGYFDVAQNMSMFFWFFEARKNASTAPLAAWFQGGPGCSSMIGLFKENGPCRFVGDSKEPSLNPYSWNDQVNMLYIDEPIGAGFSYGDINVGTTYSAAPYVWTFLQAFYDAFPEYTSRDFGIFTESYGGHYGPEFARYILEQNDGIDTNQTQGEYIYLKALGINNGWIDAVDGYKALITYAEKNPYKPLVNSTGAASLMNYYNQTCLPALNLCAETGEDQDCYKSQYLCSSGIQSSITRAGGGAWNVYDVRISANITDPPDTYKEWLARPDIQQKIGAEKSFEECSDASGDLFLYSGDDSRPFIQELSIVAQFNVSTIIWAGDADWICNYQGALATANRVNYTDTAGFNKAALKPYTVRGKSVGEFKRQGALNYLNVKGAGHQVMYYAPEASLQVFNQMMKGDGLVST